MTVKTRDFGEVEVSQDDVVEFVEPILGFEDLERFVFLYSQVDCEGFVWLQSTEEEEICFILAAPEVLDEKYTPSVPAALGKKLGEGELTIWLVTVVRDDFTESTVNLKSPIFLNIKTRRAGQVVLEENYPIRKSLFQK